MKIKIVDFLFIYYFLQNVEKSIIIKYNSKI